MANTHSIYASTTVSMTDLRRNPSGILQDAGDSPVAVLNHNRAEAYLLPAAHYEALITRLEDLEDAQLVAERAQGPFTEISLDAL